MIVIVRTVGALHHEREGAALLAGEMIASGLV